MDYLNTFEFAYLVKKYYSGTGPQRPKDKKTKCVLGIQNT